ncbi:hypothetical protein QFZ55_000189 [Streptomyces luteogriseus]|uniref:hypothetical protein n=1 Tax=Streptomyces luteogriseus TaxID=68233 RepID=UPI002785D529|nr:hypothetical protein [Streptomyces luteogriseus]MDQ0710737.1 hypothetical protein [Streptomyces luteogriseus]
MEQFLKEESDPARRAVALACALPQELNEDVYRAAVGQEVAELFAWLRALPFVTDHGGHCRYHEVVRTAMLRLQYRQCVSPFRQLENAFAAAA